MDDNKQLLNLQLEQIEIAKEIKRVCNIASITYFLAFGTLLGAIRHNGFIPWDDDMDVGMLRPDYERFIVAFMKYGNHNRFFLETWDSEKGYPFPFAKLKINGTVFLENSIKNSDVHKGIYVDIFPYDFICDDEAKRLKLGKRMDFLLKFNKFKLNYLPMNPNSKKDYIVSRILHYIGILIPEKLIKGKIDALSKKYNDCSTDYYGCTGSPYKMKDALKREYLSGVVEHDFASESFLIPQRYDEILRSIYGDYMKLPPIEKRVTRHFPEEIVFEEMFR